MYLSRRGDELVRLSKPKRRREEECDILSSSSSLQYYWKSLVPLPCFLLVRVSKAREVSLSSENVEEKLLQRSSTLP